MKPSKSRKLDELRSEYDFSGGLRGKHHEAYPTDRSVVLLDPDVARAFPDSGSVNRALPLLLEIAEQRQRSKRKASPDPEGRSASAAAR